MSIVATPETLSDLIEKAKPGDVFQLEAGTYAVLSLKRLRGTVEKPIVIEGPKDAIFDGQRRFEDFRKEANIIAKRAQDEGSFPSLGREAHRGFVRLKNCSHIILRGFSIRGCWPTGIYLNNCVGMEIDSIDFQEGTFAIFADGRRCRGIRVRNCDYVQDISEGRLWREIDWDLVHGGQPVDLEKDARAFDGDFFRSFGITGDVTIENNRISHAFNGIHMFHSDRDGVDRSENRNVCIRGNTFRYIRDNAIEPEWGGWNWWIFHNDIFNCHKWISLEMRRSGHFYVFGNTGWFDEVPGPPGDDNTGGAVFKLPSRQRASEGMHYVFNNSFYLRSTYIKKKQILNFWNFNNAIAYCAPNTHPNGSCTPRGFFGGPLGFTGEGTPPAFTTDWRRLNIRFFGDVIGHNEWPETLRAKGYAIEETIAKDPAFLDPAAGDFRLQPGSPTIGAGHGLDMDLADGTRWTLGAGLNCGAVQSDGRRLAPPGRIPWSEEPAFLTV